MKNVKKLGGYLFHKQFPWCMFIVLFIIFSFSSEYFLQGKNISNILIQNAYIAVLSMGIMLLLITGAMDLALGYEISLIGVCTGMLMVKGGANGIVAVLFAIVLGIALQLVNTFLSQVLRIAMILTTLGTMTIYQGIAFTISNADVFKGFDESFLYLGRGEILGVNMALIITVIILILTGFILNKTYIGKHILAVGGNEKAAKLSGIAVSKIRYVVAVITGAFVGLGSVLMFARLGSAQGSYGPGTEFTAITACCLGGVSITGGKGSVVGVLAGVLVLGLISNGMQLAGLGAYAQYIIKGAILLASFGLDVLQRQQQEKAKLLNTK